ncbi:hypothetical protein H8A97_24480 [Bradyrhizobium sp. Arg62]|uniref:hypothetical protein n=1 Tax=Bradyrhizobium brasilense TaxID=1419277 RepID=UPI001E611BA3|nr:hypothetical protein [Bradyrhizobium brasilense]MCC8948180.1 hypothetical protein [Bradyrhizobium brasilense]
MGKADRHDMPGQEKIASAILESFQVRHRGQGGSAAISKHLRRSFQRGRAVPLQDAMVSTHEEHVALRFAHHRIEAGSQWERLKIECPD